MYCPCPTPWEEEIYIEDESLLSYEDYTNFHRHLQEADSDGTTTNTTEEEEAPVGSTWEMIYVGVVLVIMFGVLLSDRVGADLVMLTALTACMCANIITIDEGMSGFSNEGVLTVVVLFVVAAGIQLTGALDWYMGKLLGRPVNASAAQLRLMIPISIISAFLNNTPVVVIMIPICLKWGKNTGISPAQLLVPLSFASILGGTCTLIGTSTNLVVAGLLTSYYSDASPEKQAEMQIGLFDLGEFGVPILFIGMSYIIIAAPFLLPGGRRKGDTSLPIDDDGTILLGARLTKWSPAAGRTVKRSGLRDTGGIYLVSVYRARSGNIHRAVGQDFVMNVDDVLYFTGMVSEFSQFCESHGLEVITNEIDITNVHKTNNIDLTPQDDEPVTETRQTVVKFSSAVEINEEMNSNGVNNDDLDEDCEQLPLTHIETRSRRSSINFISEEGEKLQAINRMTDMIRGFNPSQPLEFDSIAPKSQRNLLVSGSTKVVVSIDSHDIDDVVIVGINANDRPGLLLDISRGLHSLGLQLHHTEASVIQGKSISIWRCALIEEGDSANAGEMETVLGQIIENDGGGAGVSKQRGLSVIRTVVTDQSRLVDKTCDDIDFRKTYKAAIVGVQKKDKSEVNLLTEVVFAPGDVLVLQADEDSFLLVRPPDKFYTKSSSDAAYKNIFNKAVGGLRLSSSSNDLKEKASEATTTADDSNIASVTDSRKEEVWNDLHVLFPEEASQDDGGGNASREFLAAVKVAPKSSHIGKTVFEAGLNRQAGLFLVGVERPVTGRKSRMQVSFATPSLMPGKSPFDSGISVEDGSMNDSAMASITKGSQPKASIPVPPEGHLKENDVLWFAGGANSIADMRKIPGLVSLEDDELQQIEEHLHDRRLVQAVVARKGPLVGKTAGEVRFRTTYGAAVIAVHRDGTRVQDHPGNIRLRGGDVLLLEAGPTFISKNSDNQQSFALISEVADSKPPRLNKLLPALLITLVMLIVVAIGPVLFPEQNISSLLVCGLVVSFIFVCLGMLSQQECRDAVDWVVYVTIACAFGIGTAMENSGLASLIANGLVQLGNALGIGYAGLYGSVYLATVLISNIVTNNAAAALMFPIAIEAAVLTGADEKLMSYNLMLAASASFMSPFGYTTNLLIYGPGGYKVKDFVYMGTPLQVVLWILTTLILSNETVPWWVAWLWTFGVFILTCTIFVFPAYVKIMFNRGLEAGKITKD